jgi:hypothetical protein
MCVVTVTPAKLNHVKYAVSFLKQCEGLVVVLSFNVLYGAHI